MKIIAQVVLILVLACLDQAKASSSKAAKANSAEANDAKAKIGAQHIIAPFKCPGSCVVSEENSDGVLEANVRLFTAVDNDSYSDQVLVVHDNDMFIKLESATHSGQCVGVIEDNPESEGGMCGGRVGFASCELPAAQWYFTGGRFLSAACWALGLSSVLAADEGCSALGVGLAVDNGNVVVNPTTLTQTFMLLEPPKFIEEKVVGAPYKPCTSCSYNGGNNNGYTCGAINICHPKREDGESCSKNIKCISNYCDGSVCKTKNEDGESCGKNSDCISNICEGDECVCSACAGTGGPWYCYGGACREKLNDGESCGSDNDCKGGDCHWYWFWGWKCTS